VTSSVVFEVDPTSIILDDGREFTGPEDAASSTGLLTVDFERSLDPNDVNDNCIMCLSHNE
jgi:hypothetical protein